MFLKVLTILDFFVLAFLLLLNFEMFSSWKLAVVAMIYLVGKGLLFFGDLFSFMDMAAGIYVVVLMLGLNIFLTYIFAAYFGYKVLLGLSG